jgi:hypothetical protein
LPAVINSVNATNGNPYRRVQSFVLIQVLRFGFGFGGTAALCCTQW